ncbi:hypothetical protein ACFQRK_01950 [Parapedobacter sp. GCM10030251]|uniref:hypothetical protein n=1 Tax=Parapedobacter sp. GCM10030251 TaxID=3273419 RepID=UPI0036135138
MLLPRRNFLKGMGIAALTAYLSDSSLVFSSTSFSAVLHIGGIANDLLKLPQGIHGMLLHEAERNLETLRLGASELWVVEDDHLVLLPNGVGGRYDVAATGNKSPYLIRQIGRCRTAIFGLTLDNQISGIANGIKAAMVKSDKLRQLTGCKQVYCMVSGPAFNKPLVKQIIAESRGVDQWFIPTASEMRKANQLVNMKDADGNYVLVSLNETDLCSFQRITHQDRGTIIVDSRIRV